MTTAEPRAALDQAISRVMRSIAHTGEARLRWEKAKAEGSPQIFQVAQAHRTSEKELAAQVEKAVQAYCAASLAGAITLEAPPAQE